MPDYPISTTEDKIAMPVMLPVDAVVFREDLYPRFTPDAATIQKYQQSLEALPPIEVNQRHELIDGYHRWSAFREEGASVVPAVITPTQSDDELLDLAIDRNAKHGMQLSQSEKKSMARRLYTSRQRSKPDLCRLLSVGKSVMAEWLSDIDKAEREKQKADARDLWLACHTQEEIAESVGVTDQTIANWLREILNLPAVFTVQPENMIARAIVPEQTVMSEREYVEFLFALGKQEPDVIWLEGRSTFKPNGKHEAVR